MVLKKLIVASVCAMSVTPTIADEGMWILPLINNSKWAEMNEMGLELPPADIYDPENASLKDAVVIFGGGCTGEVVSPDGLIFTNHHCGYSSIQQHSSVENDYLTDGFWAMDRSEELPNPGLKVTFIDKIDDVTDYVKEQLEIDGDSTGMMYLSPKYLNGLAEKKVGENFLDSAKGVEVEIKPFYGGNKYFMFTKKIYPDVRLVGAPPSSMGKFGADTDNWMWPRHTGDFAVFRVYADAEGQPAEYSESNVPLRPKKWLKISTAGVNEDDFAMIMGFPGRTNRYYTSWEVAERRDIDNAVRINIRDIRQKIMLDEMLRSDSVRIQYSSKYARSTNSYKNAIGSNWAINKRNFEKIKADEQQRLLDWAPADKKQEYVEALNSIENIVAEREDLRFRQWMMNEAVAMGIEFYAIPTDFTELITALESKNDSAIDVQLASLEKSYEKFANKDYAAYLDQRIATAMLREMRNEIPQEQQPEQIQIIGEKRFDGDEEVFVEYLFDNSIFGSRENLDKFLAKPSVKKLQKDPMINFVKGMKQEAKDIKEEMAQYDIDYLAAHKTYVAGLLDMYGEDNAPFADANFTLRLTNGKVKGYSPRDGVEYAHQTTLDGVMEKEDSTNWEFVVPKQLKELYNNKDFGPYANPDGKMPVAFAATTHTTGGNSGSPVLNGQGELIGINFDRNWEGVGGDINYLPDYQRSIIVDIRYVLFVIDKYAGAGYLLEEIDIVE